MQHSTRGSLKMELSYRENTDDNRLLKSLALALRINKRLHSKKHLHPRSHFYRLHANKKSQPSAPSSSQTPSQIFSLLCSSSIILPIAASALARSSASFPSSLFCCQCASPWKHMQGKMRMKNAKTIPRVMPMMAVLSECEPCLGVEVEVALAEAMSVVREDIFFFFSFL